MNLNEILGMISRKYPHALSAGEVTTYINMVQAELFRGFCRKITTKTYDLLPGISNYPLPFADSKIVDVIVNGEAYPHKNMQDNGLSKFAYFLDGTIGIYPAPKEPGTMVIFHEIEPALLSLAGNTMPDLDKDFHMLLVYGACAHIAEEARDIEYANGFTARYNGLLTDYKNATDEPEYHVIQNVWGGLT